MKFDPDASPDCRPIDYYFIKSNTYSINSLGSSPSHFIASRDPRRRGGEAPSRVAGVSEALNHENKLETSEALCNRRYDRCR